MGLTAEHTAGNRHDALAASLTVQILTRLFGERLPDFAVRLWNGTVIPSVGTPRFTLVLNHPGALRWMFLPPTDLAVGEAFLRRDFDVEGSLEAAIGLGQAVAAQVTTARDRLTLARMLASLPRAVGWGWKPSRRAALRGRRHSFARDRQAIAHHYDVGNEFFRLWLDHRLTYSCAYFETEEQTLDLAQEAKLDLICRKLRLQPGDRLLDIGCGWGSLVMYAAERYGVSAVGVTLSQPQAAYAREAIAAAGLVDRCRVLTTDYREIRGERFDKIASVGMFEHVGRERLPEYFSTAWTLLQPGGLFLNHGIAAREARASRPLPWRCGESFIQRYVFPDGELVPISEALVAAERAGFEVRDIESLREHYALTLRHWVRRLEAQRDEAARIVGEEVYRVWRLFMSGSAYGFATASLSVFQALLARPDASGRVDLPLTRRHMVSPGR